MIRAFAAGVAPARLAGTGTAFRSHVVHEMASVCTIRHTCQGAFQGRGLHARAVARTLGQPVSKANKVRTTPSRIPRSYFYSTANTRAHHGSFSVLGRGSARIVTPFQQTRAMSNAMTRFAGNFSVNSSNKVVYAIVAINVAVFATWQYAEANAQRFRDGRLYYFMFRNFTDSAQNLREGRVWTLVTSAFSHKEWYHIILNTMVLLSFGDPVWRMLGTRRFLAVYLGSAVTASLSSIAYYSHLEPYLRRMQNKPRSNNVHYSLGASGAVMGMTTAFACVYPMSQYSLFFVINMPAAALIGLFGAYELYNVLAVNTGRFDSAGHLGGGMFGAAYYFTRLRPLMRIMGRR
ncbi:MAG: hypothetical protein BYD32DRAFT_459348 [Podila humilis]|nr:MAG: hypothetical protein BYD32DRAFT_459348 [Podila humilis]